MNDEILKWLLKYDLWFDESKYHIHDGIIDVVGDVYIRTSCKSLPYKFGNVTGSFSINGCDISLLVNCPNYVGWWFDCDCTNIKSLQNIPKCIGGDIYFQCCPHLKDISDIWNVTFLNDKLRLGKNISNLNVVKEYSEWLKYISNVKTVELL